MTPEDGTTGEETQEASPENPAQGDADGQPITEEETPSDEASPTESLDPECPIDAEELNALAASI